PMQRATAVVVTSSGDGHAFGFFFQAEDGIRDFHVTGVQTCALPIYDNDYLLSMQQVTGNDQVVSTVVIPENPTNAAKIELSIQKWSHPGRQAKILEFLNTVYKLEISPNDYFSKDNPSRYAEVANYIVVETQPMDSNGNKLPGVKVIAKDDESITENGLLPYEFPGNPLVQTVEMAEEIAGRLLRTFKDPRRNLELDWRGNPAL